MLNMQIMYKVHLCLMTQSPYVLTLVTHILFSFFACCYFLMPVIVTNIIHTAIHHHPGFCIPDTHLSTL